MELEEKTEDQVTFFQEYSESLNPCTQFGDNPCGAWSLKFDLVVPEEKPLSELN